jgi:hypothetical protein
VVPEHENERRERPIRARPEGEAKF